MEFIRTGGLAASRAKEKAEIEEERRRLRQDQMSPGRRRLSNYELDDSEDKNRLIGIASARDLLKLLIG